MNLTVAPSECGRVERYAMGPGRPHQRSAITIYYGKIPTSTAERRASTSANTAGRRYRSNLSLLGRPCPSSVTLRASLLEMPSSRRGVDGRAGLRPDQLGRVADHGLPPALPHREGRADFGDRLLRRGGVDDDEIGRVA